jgi:heme-degrading monooxygenase HmoA
MAVARIWRTRIDEHRAADYRTFALEHSLSMFRAHAGFIGVVFGGADGERVVITFWRDADAVGALAASPRYRETVRDIEASGFIVGPSSIDVYEIDGGAFDKSIF